MPEPLAHDALFIDELRGEARRYKDLADQALAQVDDAGFVFRLDAESNCLALIVKHVASNLRSRWTNVYATDGEKPDRQRDREFELEPDDTRPLLMTRWDAGWGCFLETLDRMEPADLGRTVLIRSEPHTVTRAALRSLAHTASHVGQIVHPRQARRRRSLGLAQHPARAVGAGQRADARAVRAEVGRGEASSSALDEVAVKTSPRPHHRGETPLTHASRARRCGSRQSTRASRLAEPRSATSRKTRGGSPARRRRGRAKDAPAPHLRRLTSALGARRTAQRMDGVDCGESDGAARRQSRRYWSRRTREWRRLARTSWPLLSATR